MQKLSPRWKKIVVGIAGGSVLLVGIVLIPYPGPGWLIVFAGLGILSSEFHWASRLLKSARRRYDSWNNWVASQSRIVRYTTWIFTAIVVIVTIWLVNGYGLINNLFHLNLDWLKSPFFR